MIKVTICACTQPNCNLYSSVAGDLECEIFHMTRDSLGACIATWDVPLYTGVYV